MALATSQNTSFVVRPVQYKDLDSLEAFFEAEEDGSVANQLYPDLPSHQRFEQMRRWYVPLKFLSFMPRPIKHLFYTYVAVQSDQLCGLIQVSPFNRTRSTWRVDRVAVDSSKLNVSGDEQLKLASDAGSLMLRHCFESFWEARTWLLEVSVNDKDALALYRQNGFQPLAHLTYWAINPEQIQTLAEQEPTLPNLLPVSNADAQLLYQLDTASMPPLVRQVFDHQIQDFKTGLFSSCLDSIRHWLNRTEVVSGYVFESQRKAAIGYFRVECCRDGHQAHRAKLTVHPAYTWLYPELVSQMARIVKSFPEQSLHVSSSDYQPEREEYLTRIEASPIEQTLMMSRSVWHKLRESKPVSLDALQLSDMLQGLQPSRKPVPGRMSWRMSPSSEPSVPYHESTSLPDAEVNGNVNGNGNGGQNRDSATDNNRPKPGRNFPDLSQDGSSG